MAKHTIAIIDNSIDVTGAFKAILDFATYAKNEYSFLFILPNESKCTKLLVDSCHEVITLPYIELRKNWKNLLLYLPVLILNGIKIKKILNRKKVDILHINDFYNLLGVMVKFLGVSTKLIVHVRFMPNKFNKVLINVWLSLNSLYADKIICVSYAVFHQFKPNDKLTVIYDGIRLNLNKRLVREGSGKNINLLYLSNFIQGKGQDFAIKAFNIAHKENPELRLRFVGGDMNLQKNQEFKNSIISTVNALKLQNFVEFGSFTLDVADEYNEADIFLNFSESESFSRTCLEAMEHGVPIIATDSGGPAELFQNGESGILVPNRDIDKMAEAILLLAADIKLRAKFSEMAVLHANQKFSPQRTHSKLLGIYNQLIPN